MNLRNLSIGITWLMFLSLSCSPLKPVETAVVVSGWSFFDKDDIFRNTVGNNDKTPQSGETVRVNVELTNFSSEQVMGIQAEYKINDSYVTLSINDNSYYYGTMTSKGNKSFLDLTDGILIVIDSTCPSGHEVTVNLDIKDQDVNTWTDSFKFIVQ